MAAKTKFRGSMTALVTPFKKDGALDEQDSKTAFWNAFKALGGTRSIAPMGHVRMMAACQPFLSGAISKTVNLPESATVEEIADVYFQGWKLGLKALAVYRETRDAARR